MTRLLIAVGTRPEIIKMAPVLKKVSNLGQDFKLVHSGQHYDYNLSQKFIREIGFPQPDYLINLAETTPASQTGRMMMELENVLLEECPELLLIQGDTNTMLAAALSGFKQNIPVGHIEAGLRSYDPRMPEEHNRRMVDHASELLFPPTERARENLEKESVLGEIHVTGNTVIDAVEQNLPIAEKKSDIIKKIKFDKYILFTAHRCENVDDPNILSSFIDVILESPTPVIFPIHPRTEKNLKENNLWDKLQSCENVQCFPPLGYFDFLILMKNCEVILTDSGGLQEEATAPSIRKPVLVLRISTERPEAVEENFAKVVGVKKERIISELRETLNRKENIPRHSPFGDGSASEKIAKIVKERLD